MGKTYQSRGGERLQTQRADGPSVINSIDDLLEYCLKSEIKYQRTARLCEQCNEQRASAIAKGRADAMTDLLELLAPFVEKLPKRDKPRSGVTITDYKMPDGVEVSV